MSLSLGSTSEHSMEGNFLLQWNSENSHSSNEIKLL
nr:MAG TPA: hypothetical protein [Bacteriophage sp.]